MTVYDVDWGDAADRLHVRGATIGELLDEQRELQRKFGHDFETMTLRERVAYVKDMVLATTDELHEAMAETSWKPWQSARYINEPAYKIELIDALHFLMNLMLVVQMTGDEVTALYRSKRRTNIKRQTDGYSGIKKCPICKRSYDDPSTKCTYVAPDNPDYPPSITCVDLKRESVSFTEGG